MKLLRPCIVSAAAGRRILLFHHLALECEIRRLESGELVDPSRASGITEASGSEGLDSEEQNNISVYRKNIPSVVNVTSRAMSFDFFYGMVPQEGQGSGFVIDREGHILTNYQRRRRRAPGRSHNAQPQEVQSDGCGHRPRARSGRDPDQGARPGAIRSRRLAQRGGTEVYAMAIRSASPEQ